MKQYTISIQEIRKETKDTVTLCFKQPGLRKIKYQAGQYITLILRINGRKYARPYSFSSAPSVDSALEVTVKRVIDGIVSNYINNELKVGDIIEVLEPMGDFTYDLLNPKQTIFLWGVGSGITPIFSIIKEVLHKQLATSIYLIYGNKNEESTIFRDQINLLKQKYKGMFFVTNFYSEVEKVDQFNSIHKGRISSEFVTSLIAQHSNMKESAHFICGPKSLKDKIQISLMDLGIPAHSIFVEDFNLLIDSKELEGVRDCKVAIHFQGKSTEVFVSKGKRILDAALDAGIDIPYSCKTGNCDTCKGYLKNGKLKMIGLTKQRADLANDEFLLCCSYPITDEVYVNVN